MYNLRGLACSSRTGSTLEQQDLFFFYIEKTTSRTIQPNSLRWISGCWEWGFFFISEKVIKNLISLKLSTVASLISNLTKKKFSRVWNCLPFFSILISQEHLPKENNELSHQDLLLYLDQCRECTLFALSWRENADFLPLAGPGFGGKTDLETWKWEWREKKSPSSRKVPRPKNNV